MTFSLPGQLQNITPISDLPQFQIEQLWSIEPSNGPGALITPEGANQRTIAYNFNPEWNELYLVSRDAPDGSNYVIYVMDPQTGTNLLDGTNLITISTEGIYNGGAVGEDGIGLASLAVAEDAAVYGCNMTVDACSCGPNAANAADSLFRVYRWADANTSTRPVEVFAGDPAGVSVPVRWGDTLAARGSGTNTQLLLDSSDGKYVALLTPTDDSLTNFTSILFTNKSGVTPVARSLDFLGTNTFLQKGKGGSLRVGVWDGTNSFGIQGSSHLPATLGQFAINGFGLGAGIDFTGTATRSDLVSVYDLLNFSAPARVGFTNFSTNANANPEFAGKVVFNNSSFGNRIWALDANRGLVALSVTGPRSIPVHTAVPARIGTSEIIKALAQAMNSNNAPGAKLVYKITGTNVTNLQHAFYYRRGTNEVDVSQYLRMNEQSAALSQTVKSLAVTNATRYGVGTFHIATPLLSLNLQGLLTEKFIGPADSTNALSDSSLSSITASSLDGGGFAGAALVVHGSAAFTGRKIEVVANRPPSVALLSPANSQSFIASSDITLTASASDADGTVTLVEFFQDGNKLGESASAPYKFIWTNVPVGSFGISVKGTDNDGASAFSATNAIVIQAPIGP